MGVWEVLKHYSWFKKKFNEMLAQFSAEQPDALVLIDYPGFNLRMAKAVRAAVPHTKIIYYISPQVWAWNKKRIPQMAKILDKMLCIFPFEKDIFEKAGLPTTFVGHPIVDELGEKKQQLEREKNLIGLFPGSREREVSRLFPVMVEAVRRLTVRRLPFESMASGDDPWVYEASAASEKMHALMASIIEEAGLPENIQIKLTTGESHALMQRATCGVIASGTATLEAAYMGLPYCLCYKVAWPTFFLGKMLVKVDFIGIVNILAGRQVVEEFIQGDADPLHMEKALEHLMTDHPYREKVEQDVIDTAALLGEPGAHNRAAAEILETIV